MSSAILRRSESFFLFFSLFRYLDIERNASFFFFALPFFWMFDESRCFLFFDFLPLERARICQRLKNKKKPARTEDTRNAISEMASLERRTNVLTPMPVSPAFSSSPQPPAHLPAALPFPQNPSSRVQRPLFLCPAPRSLDGKSEIILSRSRLPLPFPIQTRINTTLSVPFVLSGYLSVLTTPPPAFATQSRLFSPRPHRSLILFHCCV